MTSKKVDTSIQTSNIQLTQFKPHEAQKNIYFWCLYALHEMEVKHLYFMTLVSFGWEGSHAEDDRRNNALTSQ